ncbi:Receptor for activated protein kinase C [Entamoeba marina]
MADKALAIELKSTLVGHNGWVSAVACSSSNAELLVTGSRDKTVMIWKVDTNNDQQEEIIRPFKSLHGHSHFINDLVLSSDAQFALTASWDHTLRLWDLNKMESVKRFVGHESDVMSVAISPDSTRIISGGRDKTIRLWNTLGRCVTAVKTDSHTEWVSCVRNKFVSCGWDKEIKTWTMDQSCKLESTITHHNGFVNVAFSPDGSIMASAGKDGIIAIWSLNNGTGLYEFLYDIAVNCPINALVFPEDPTNYSLIAGTDLGIILVKDKEIKAFKQTSACLSVTLSATKDVIFTGHSDNNVRMWKVGIASTINA